MLVERKRLLRQAVALADGLTLTASLGAAYQIVGVGLDRRFSSFAGYAWLLWLIIPIWLGCLAIFGFYRSAAYSSRVRLLVRLAQAHFVAGLLLLSLMYLTRSEIVSRLLMQSFLAISFVLLIAQKVALAAYLESAQRRTNLGRRKVVLVSHPAIADQYLRLIQTRVSILADVIRVLAPGYHNENAAGLVAAGFPLGSVEDLPELLRAQVVDEVVAVAPLDPPVLDRLSRWCTVQGTTLRIWLELPRSARGFWTASYFGEGAFLLSLATVPQTQLLLLAKRAIDVFGASAGILLCCICYLWYGLRLRRETGGSVLFRQKRIGINGRPFTLYKFRTMCREAEQQQGALSVHNQMNGPMFKIKEDPRVTPTGRKLRSRHLDELPQFWNVLMSDMSLVGTRPPTADETRVYADHHRRRLSMKPGLTGLWQLNGNGQVHDFEDVVKLDCEYIDKWSLWLDVKILVKTLTKVMRGDAW